MLSKDAFKKLVLAGAITAKNTIATDKIEKIIQDVIDEDEDECVLPEEVYEIAEECDFRVPLAHIASCIFEIVGTDCADSYTVKYKYLDAVSLAAFDNEKSEHYTDLVYQFFFDPANVVEELAALEDTLPKEELYYVRRYVMLHNEMM